MLKETEKTMKARDKAWKRHKIFNSNITNSINVYKIRQSMLSEKMKLPRIVPYLIFSLES